MKYTRLTKEQLEVLNHDFARFLATQQITADEWQLLKKEKPQVAEDELDIFSDLVWEKSLEKVRFLERVDKHAIYCFLFEDDSAQMIAIQIDNINIDLTSTEGFIWLKNNILDKNVHLFSASKKNISDRKMEIFKLIQQGMQISDGKLFQALKEMT